MSMPRLASCALVVLGLALMPGCRSLIHADQWFDMDEEYDVEFSVLWGTIKHTLGEKYETIEWERSAEGVLRTGWKEELNYLAGEGYREKAHVKVVKGERGYRVYVRVARESNEEPIYTLESRHARWASADDNSARAQHLVGLIHVRMASIIEEK